MEILHSENYKLRKKILIFCVVILLVALAISIEFLPDFLVKENELASDTGIIQYSFMNKYSEYLRHSGRTVYVNCLDVVLVNKPYSIRFDDVSSKYWEIIGNKGNLSKRIQVKYQERLLHENILWNPNEVIIDNKIIIPADSDKVELGCIILFLVGIIIVCLYLMSPLWKQYKRELYQEDKQLGQISIWKLIMVWVDDLGYS